MFIAAFIAILIAIHTAVHLYVPCCALVASLERSGATFDHGDDFVRLFKVIQFVGLDPPGRGFHEKFGIVIAVSEKGVKRYPDIVAFLGNFLLADV